MRRQSAPTVPPRRADARRRVEARRPRSSRHSCGWPWRAPHQSAQARRELVQVDRLDHVVVGAEVERRGSAPAPRRAPSARAPAASGSRAANLRQHLDAVHAAAGPGRAPRRRRPARATRARAASPSRTQSTRKPSWRKPVCKAITEQRVVFGEQDAHGGVGGWGAMSVRVQAKPRTGPPASSIVIAFALAALLGGMPLRW